MMTLKPFSSSSWLYRKVTRASDDALDSLEKEEPELIIEISSLWRNATAVEYTFPEADHDSFDLSLSEGRGAK